MIDKLVDAYCRLLCAVMVVCLALMVVMVFGNVVLRYGFNSGIAVSDEVSRWLFVWMTFLGAIVALREHGHLGTDMLVGHLGVAGKKTCLVLSHLLMLFCCWLLFKGSLDQTRINWDVSGATTGASVAIFYASGIAFSVSAAVLIALELFKVLSGRLKEVELVMVRESEEVPHGDSGAH